MFDPGAARGVAAVGRGGKRGLVGLERWRVGKAAGCQFWFIRLPGPGSFVRGNKSVSQRTRGSGEGRHGPAVGNREQSEKANTGGKPLARRVRRGSGLSAYKSGHNVPGAFGRGRAEAHEAFCSVTAASPWSSRSVELPEALLLRAVQTARAAVPISQIGCTGAWDQSRSLTGPPCAKRPCETAGHQLGSQSPSLNHGGSNSLAGRRVPAGSADPAGAGFGKELATLSSDRHWARMRCRFPDAVSRWGVIGRTATAVRNLAVRRISRDGF